MPQIPQIPQEPQPLPKKRIAFPMAYGGEIIQTDTTYSYRLERGFPFHRAGQAVTIAAQFATLGGTTGSAVGLHVPVNQNALTNGQLDPSQPGFLQKGSNVPTFVTVAFNFNAATSTTLTISWPATPIRRANRTLLVSSDTAIPAGSIAITGLTASVTYFYYPFWSEKAMIIGWAGAGNATSAGSPAIAQTVQSDAVLQAASFQGFVPLNTLQFTQPAGGGSSNITGGYGSGNPGITGGGRTYRVF